MPAFVAKAVKLLKMPEHTIHTVARRMRCSPSTVQRATGGKSLDLEAAIGAGAVRVWLTVDDDARLFWQA